MENYKIPATRREFLGTGISALGLMMIPWDILKAKNELANNTLESSIFFSEKDIPRIIKNTKLPIFKEYWSSLVNSDLKADIKFLKEELNFNDQTWHLSRANEILKRSGLVSLIEKNKGHEETAKLAIEKILGYKDFDYFMEDGKYTIGLQRAPETTIALTFGLECMKNSLSDAVKKEMINAIAEKGLPPCYLSLYGMKYPDKVKGWGFNPDSTYKLRYDLSKWPWILDKTNLKMIPISGLIIGSVLLYDKHPEAKKWLEMGRESLERFAKLYYKDGCYPEGAGYWTYATGQLVMSVDILLRNLKINYKDLINYSGTAKFGLQMQAPFKDNPFGNINFSDTGFSTDGSLAFWIAREFKDKNAQFAGENISNRRIIYCFLYHDDSIKSVRPSQDMLDVKFDNSWVVSRTGWTENDTVLGFRSGGPANHEHADRNSIILNAFGDRLLHDPLGAAYSNTEKHWLLRQTEAHTAVLIDGKGHQYHDGSEGTCSSKAAAKILQYIAGKKITLVTSDATQAYNLVNSDVKKVYRTIGFIKPDILIIIDEMEKIKKDSIFQARFQAFNVDGKAVLKIFPQLNSFEIIRPYSKLFAKTAGSSDLKITDGKLDIPEEKGIFPFVEVSSKESSKCTMITACALMPVSSDLKPSIEIKESKGEYGLKIILNREETNLKIELNKKLPTIKLI